MGEAFSEREPGLTAWSHTGRWSQWGSENLKRAGGHTDPFQPAGLGQAHSPVRPAPSSRARGPGQAGLLQSSVLPGTSAGPQPGAHFCRIPAPVPCQSPSRTVRKDFKGWEACPPPSLSPVCHHPRGQGKKEGKREVKTPTRTAPLTLLLPRGRPLAQTQSGRAPPLPNPAHSTTATTWTVVRQGQ